MSFVAPRAGEAGLTLVEMLVALALFSLVGLASFALLDTVIATRDRTEGRLETVAALDRALILWSRDLGQSDPGSQAISEGVLTFGLRAAGGPAVMTYALVGDVLTRSAAPVDQQLASGMESLAWRGLDQGGIWHETWPPAEAADAPTEPLVGLEMKLTFAGEPPATVRRLVELPLDPAY